MGRLKAYKKLFKHYALLGFRPPYQVVVDAQFVEDTIKLDVEHLIEKAMHAKVKLMITSCCIRVLYEKNKPGTNDRDLKAVIDKAKSFERVRCGHMMDQDPLSPVECLESVINHKGKGNKYRYCLATQDENIRRKMRGIPALPLLYCKRSVIVLEPMSDATEQLRRRDETVKFRDGIKSERGTKRKREAEEEGEDQASGDESGQNEGEEVEDEQVDGQSASNGAQAEQPGSAQKSRPEPELPVKKKKRHGPKGPNPMSVRKPKRAKGEASQDQQSKKASAPESTSVTEGPQKKRKRKKKSHAITGGELGEQTVTTTTGDAAFTAPVPGGETP